MLVILHKFPYSCDWSWRASSANNRFYSNGTLPSSNFPFCFPSSALHVTWGDCVRSLWSLLDWQIPPSPCQLLIFWLSSETVRKIPFRRRPNKCRREQEGSQKKFAKFIEPWRTNWKWRATLIVDGAGEAYALISVHWAFFSINKKRRASPPLTGISDEEMRG